MNYPKDPILKKAYEDYFAWLDTPTDDRIVIVGDPISYFTKQASTPN